MRRRRSEKPTNHTPGNPDCHWCHGRGCLACKPARKARRKPEPCLTAGHSFEVADGSIYCGCKRCGRPCRVAGPFKKDAELLRRSKVPAGVCADCVITEFLVNTYPINMQIDEAGPELLLKPGIREAFLSCGILERADLTIDEVSWERVVANWDLPVDVAKKDPRNPYRMGDAKRRREARREAGLPEENKWADHFRTRPAGTPKLPPGCLMRDGTLLVDASGFRAGGGSDGSDLGAAVEQFLRSVKIGGSPS